VRERAPHRFDLEMKNLPKSMFAVALASAASGTFACATCGCTLSSDAAMGYATATGWAASLQYDFLDQDQLRRGSHAVSRTQAAALNPGADQEIEGRTTTRAVTLGIAYAPSADWGFRLTLPLLDRSHSTYGAAANPLTPDQISSARVSSLGDAKFIASWQGLLPTHAFGLQLGVKLPTGRYGGPDAAGTGVVGRRPVSFGNTGNAAGELLDTSLQAGTGSTDLIVGAYVAQAISQNLDAFVNAQFQAAVATKLDQSGADYRPGNQAALNLGLRYETHPDWTPQLQLNIGRRSHDQGALADRSGSAGTVVYLSPGVSTRLGRATQGYAFVQLPIYSRLDGYQLFPHWTASLGLSHAF
jgi:hypothetical protein